MKLSRRSIERLLELAQVGFVHLETLAERSGRNYEAAREDSRVITRARAALLPVERKGKGGLSSKRRGEAGEREAAAYLADQGFPEARRGLSQARAGGKESPDCLNAGVLHCEVKRVERLNVHDALAQAERDAGEGKLPIVLHRRNHDKWKVTCAADTFFRLYRESSYADDHVAEKEGWANRHVFAARDYVTCDPSIEDGSNE